MQVPPFKCAMNGTATKELFKNFRGQLAIGHGASPLVKPVSQYGPAFSVHQAQAPQIAGLCSGKDLPKTPLQHGFAFQA